MPIDDPDRFRRVFLLLLVVGISALFYAMVRQMLVALLLAAVFSGIVWPVHRRILKLCRGRETLASVTTIVLLIVLAILPLSAFIGIVAGQAVSISKDLKPRVEEWVENTSDVEETIVEWVPFAEQLLPYREQVIEKAGEIAGNVGSFLFKNLSAAAKGTASFFLSLFVMLYAMFYFLISGRKLSETLVYYMPMSTADAHTMLDKFVSVTRATVKGTFVIGVVQGGLAGIAFAVVGIQGPAFWGTIMAVLSIIPGIGAGLIWVPAVIYLFAVGKIAAAIGLLVWCAAVVGTADNILRPRLIGQDTEMPDLMIFLGTLGGLFLFGAAGVIIGPIVAALFITAWDMYGATFGKMLNEDQKSLTA